MDAHDTIAQWFTEAQLKHYFGARTPDEMQQIADNMQAMSSDGRRRWKKQLSVLYYKQQVERRGARKAKSTMGVLLLALKGAK